MALKPLTWHLDDFAGGLDTRDGQFSSRQNAFRELVNYRITKGKKLARRWPYIASGLTIALPSQGLIPFAGALRTVQRREDVLGSYGIAPLAFDTPDGATDTWALIDWAIFGTTVLAWIRHGYDSADYPTVCRLHVLGAPDNLPSYVDDPYCPSNWRGGLLPKPRASSYDAAWTPRIVVAQGKAYSSDADGNIAFCKSGNPRAWNVKSITSLVESGHERAFVVPESTATSLKTFVLPEAWEDFQLDVMADKLRFTAYLLEWYDESTAAWVILTEQRAAPVVHGAWRLREVPNRHGGTKTETAIDLRWTAPGSAVLRFRTILDERAVSLSGNVLTITGTSIDVTTGSHQITADGVVTEYATPILAATPLTDAQTWVLLDDSGVTTGLGTDTQSVASLVHTPPTGFQRWHNLVLVYVRLQAGVLTQAPMILDESWQAVRKIALALYAGAGDAGVLSTSFHTGSGGEQITALAILRQRLLVWYARSSQMWQIGALAADHALMDTSQIGTGDQPTPEPAPLEATQMIATPLGLRQFSIDSMLVAYIQEIGVGEQLVKLAPDGAVPTQLAAAYWPHTGQYITAVTLHSETFILCYDYAPASKVAGWSKWNIAGFAAPGRRGLAVLGDRLYVRSGDVVRCFDGSATVFRDVTDPVAPAPAFESKAVWPFNDFKAPSTTKQALYLDVVQTGKARFRLRYNPTNEAWMSGFVEVTGSTPGLGKVPFIATGPALALVLTSTDDTGHELQSVAIELISRSR